MSTKATFNKLCLKDQIQRGKCVTLTCQCGSQIFNPTLIITEILTWDSTTVSREANSPSGDKENTHIQLG